MTTIFLSITHGFQARDLLRTDVLTVLQSHGVRVVVLTPNHEDEYFTREFGGPGVCFEPLFMGSSRLEQALGAFRRFVLANFRLNQTIHALNERFHRSRRPRYVLIRLLNRFFGRVPAARRAWMRLEALLFPGTQYDAVFRRYAPSLVVTGTPGSIAADAHLLRAARRFRVRTVCVVLSWDNLTSKGHMAAVPDDLIVWNDIMKREAREFHDYPPDRVHVAGVAHFDVYARPEAPGDRERFFRRHGLDPDRRLITFGTITPWLFPYNADIAEILARAIAEGRFTQPVQLLVRLHPQVLQPGTQHTENVERYQAIAETYPHVHLDVPKVKSRALMWDLAQDDMHHLAELMRHSDVTVNAGSTLTIDSAIMDTPIVNVGFDGDREVPYAQSVVRIYDFTHYANIVRTGGVRIARSADELIKHINAYLEDPSLDREARARIVSEQCFRIDGHSGQRVGRLLLEMAGVDAAGHRDATRLKSERAASSA
jgi:hypothetical protein